MKTLIKRVVAVIAATAIFLALILVLLSNTTEKSRIDIDGLEFIDITAIDRERINADALYDAMGFNSNKWQSARERVVTLTDVSLNAVGQTSISSAKPLYSNEYERDEQVQYFKSRLQELINYANSDMGGRLKSELYIPIAKELDQWLKENSERSNKRVNIFSDMYQHSSWFSVYNNAHYYLLQSDQEGTYQIFQKEYPLPNLSGLTINIIYQPKSVEDDKRFRIVSGFFLWMFERHGASVGIIASLES